MITNGRSYSYEVTVPLSDLADVRRSRMTYQIIRDRLPYVPVVCALAPSSHLDRPLGWPKYQAYQEYERQAESIALRAAQKVCPELSGVATLPELWAEVPGVDEPSREWIIEMDAAEFADAYIETAA